MQETADELVESWINGNLSYVIEQVTHHGRGTAHPARAALLSALIFSQLDADQRPVFLRMLKERI